MTPHIVNRYITGVTGVQIFTDIRAKLIKPTHLCNPR